MKPPTDIGRAFVLQRLSYCNDLEGLRKVWDTISTQYKRDPEVFQHKERLKSAFKRAKMN